MANIIDYIDWRGDISFEISPFNEVDNLVFSELCFIDFDTIIPRYIHEGTLTLEQAAKIFFDNHPDGISSLGLIVPIDILTLFQKAAASPRYSHIRLGAYVNHIDVDLQEQFSALTFFLNDQSIYVAYRGTDDTLIGWKENFNMSLQGNVPAQKEAMEYLNNVASETAGASIFVGGHSKGGNLAIYASVFCDDSIKNRILHVYSNDGPGFHHELLTSPEYTEMMPKIETIVPQSSIVGRLLEHDNHYTVIHSSASGLWQHDGFSWQTLGTHFIPEKQLSKESEMIDRSLKKWIDSMDDSKREALIQSIYTMLTSTNAQTLTELTAEKNWLFKMLRANDSTTKKSVFGAFAQLTGEAGKMWVEDIIPFLRSHKSSPNQDHSEDTSTTQSTDDTDTNK